VRSGYRVFGEGRRDLPLFHHLVELVLHIFHLLLVELVLIFYIFVGALKNLYFLILFVST
jgi:hypothetical protein